MKWRPTGRVVSGHGEKREYLLPFFSGRGRWLASARRADHKSSGRVGRFARRFARIRGFPCKEWTRRVRESLRGCAALSRRRHGYGLHFAPPSPLWEISIADSAWEYTAGGARC